MAGLSLLVREESVAVIDVTRFAMLILMVHPFPYNTIGVE